MPKTSSLQRSHQSAFSPQLLLPWSVLPAVANLCFSRRLCCSSSASAYYSLIFIFIDMFHIYFTSNQGRKWEKSCFDSSWFSPNLSIYSFLHQDRISSLSFPRDFQNTVPVPFPGWILEVFIQPCLFFSFGGTIFTATTSFVSSSIINLPSTSMYHPLGRAEPGI